MSTVKEQLMKEVSPFLARKYVGTPECLEAANKTINWQHLVSIHVQLIPIVAGLIVAFFIFKRIVKKSLYHSNTKIIFWLFVWDFVFILSGHFLVIALTDWKLFKMVFFKECDVIVSDNLCSLIRKINLELVDFVCKLQFGLALDRLAATFSRKAYECMKFLIISILIAYLVACTVYDVYTVLVNEPLMKAGIPTNCLSLPPSGLFSTQIAFEVATLLIYASVFFKNKRKLRSQITTELENKMQAYETFACIRYMVPEVVTTGLVTFLQIICFALLGMFKDSFEPETFDLISFNISFTTGYSCLSLVLLLSTLRRSQRAQEKMRRYLIRRQQQNVNYFEMLDRVWQDEPRHIEYANPVETSFITL